MKSMESIVAKAAARGKEAAAKVQVESNYLRGLSSKDRAIYHAMKSGKLSLTGKKVKL